MARVFLHHKDKPNLEWINEEREFNRIPCIGEYVALNFSSPWYRVYAVVHCPFDAEVEAEVFLHEPTSMTDAVAAEAPISISYRERS